LHRAFCTVFSPTFHWSVEKLPKIWGQLLGFLHVFRESSVFTHLPCISYEFCTFEKSGSPVGSGSGSFVMLFPRIFEGREKTVSPVGCVVDLTARVKYTLRSFRCMTHQCIHLGNEQVQPLIICGRQASTEQNGGYRAACTTTAVARHAFPNQ